MSTEAATPFALNEPQPQYLSSAKIKRFTRFRTACQILLPLSMCISVMALFTSIDFSLLPNGAGFTLPGAGIALYTVGITLTYIFATLTMLFNNMKHAQAGIDPIQILKKLLWQKVTLAIALIIGVILIGISLTALTTAGGEGTIALMIITTVAQFLSCIYAGCSYANSQPPVRGDSNYEQLLSDAAASPGVALLPQVPWSAPAPSPQTQLSSGDRLGPVFHTGETNKYKSATTMPKERTNRASAPQQPLPSSSFRTTSTASAAAMASAPSADIPAPATPVADASAIFV